MGSFKAYSAVLFDKHTHTRVATTSIQTQNISTTTTSSLVPLCRQGPPLPPWSQTITILESAKHFRVSPELAKHHPSGNIQTKMKNQNPFSQIKSN